MGGWLPTTVKECERLGWDWLDVILFSGDAYVDHPSFGSAVIGRVLEAHGYRVAIVPQPNWQDDLRDFRKLGAPRLFFGVSAGSMDSMVNRYTAGKRLRSEDAYTPDGRHTGRPEYPSIVYTKALKKLFPDVPVVLGGIEASMRRFTHYMWMPDIPEDGDYAVYVTYQSDSTRVDDARYIVFHSGGTTTFHVNQRIGGGTWLYLGTFRFKKGQTPQGMVTLDNSSSTRGTVNADAVRFGGGMARETRAGLDVEIERYNIGSRYYTRFAGAPDSIYNKYDGADDYREDIWTRPYMTTLVGPERIYTQP